MLPIDIVPKPPKRLNEFSLTATILVSVSPEAEPSLEIAENTSSYFNTTVKVVVPVAIKRVNLPFDKPLLEVSV